MIDRTWSGKLHETSVVWSLFGTQEVIEYSECSVEQSVCYPDNSQLKTKPCIHAWNILQCWYNHNLIETHISFFSVFHQRQHVWFFPRSMTLGTLQDSNHETCQCFSLMFSLGIGMRLKPVLVIRESLESGKWPINYDILVLPSSNWSLLGICWFRECLQNRINCLEVLTISTVQRHEPTGLTHRSIGSHTK